jgi:hypothetical protein
MQYAHVMNYLDHKDTVDLIVVSISREKLQIPCDCIIICGLIYPHRSHTHAPYIAMQFYRNWALHIQYV